MTLVLLFGDRIPSGPTAPVPHRDKPTPPLSPSLTSRTSRSPTTCRRPVGRSAAWWGSIKREFYDWKSVLYLEFLTVANCSFPTHRACVITATNK